jgi:hypothetical protein
MSKAVDTLTSQSMQTFKVETPWTLGLQMFHHHLPGIFGLTLSILVSTFPICCNTHGERLHIQGSSFC